MTPDDRRTASGNDGSFLRRLIASLSNGRGGRQMPTGSNPGKVAHTVGPGGLSLILIAGPPRSGTTWLHRELSKAEGVSDFLPECTLLTQQLALYSRTLGSCDPQRFAAYFGTPEALVSVYREQVSRMLDLTASLNVTSDTRTLILKDPELSHVLSSLDDVMPAHQLVVLMRDPRDVIASIKRVGQRKGEVWDIRKSTELIYGYYHVINLYRQKVGKKKARIVRYEDLVKDKLNDLRDSLKLPRPAEGADESVAANVESRLSKSDPFFSELYLKPTTTDAVGSYAATLEKDEAAHIEHIFAGVMKDWGYAKA